MSDELREAAALARALAKMCLTKGDREGAEKAIMMALRADAMVSEDRQGPDWTDLRLKPTNGPFVDDAEFEPAEPKAQNIKDTDE